MVKKIMKVSDNLVFVYFTDRPSITIATNNGTALRLALDIQVETFKESVRKEEKALEKPSPFLGLLRKSVA